MRLAAEHRERHILVVEPNDITRKLITGILTSQGYGVWEAADGDAAGAFLGKGPSLVILDVDGEDPGVLGFLHKLKMNHSALPLVAMSEQEDRAALVERIGVANLFVLEKPVMPEKLLIGIQGHLVAGVERGMAEAPPRAIPRAEPPVDETRMGFMRRAIDLAQENLDRGGAPFGAVITRGGRIIAEGWNEVKAQKDPTAHAEIMAIRKAAAAVDDVSLAGCEVFTSCEPCPMCLGALYWAKADRLFYGATLEDAAACGTDDDYIVREIAQPEHKRTLPSRMLLHAEAKIVLDNWLKDGDR